MNPLLLFLPGLVAGSFANVVIHRVPRGESIVRPPSSCPRCSRRLSPLENLPLLSFLLLRGRCRGCGARISLRYPVVELGIALLWVGAGIGIGFTPQLPAHLVFVSTLVTLAAIDVDCRRLPNKVLAPTTIMALLLLGGAAVFSGRPAALQGAGAGAVAYGVPMLALALAVPGGMGMGDVKFAAYLGLHLGSMSLLHVAVGAFSAFSLGALGGISMIFLGKKGRKETIPFGPAMALGAGVSLFWGESILRWWLG